MFSQDYPPIKPIRRKNEQKQIETFVKNRLEKKFISRCLILAGMPEPGKTIYSSFSLKTLFFRNFVEQLS